MPFTQIAAVTSANVGSNPTVTSSALAIVAGDLVVCNVTNETNVALSSAADSLANPLAVRALNFNGTAYGASWAWYIAPTSGSLTITATFVGATTNPRIEVSTYRPTGGVPAFATAIETANDFTGAGATIYTGNITVSGTDGIALLGMNCENGTTVQQINGSAATQTNNLFGGAIYQGYLTYGAGFTGQGVATVAGSTRWVANLIAFEIPSGPVVDAPPPRSVYQPADNIAVWTPKWKVQARPPLNAQLLNVFTDGGGWNARDAVMRNVSAQWWAPPPPLPAQPRKINQPGAGPPPPDNPLPLPHYQTAQVLAQWWARPPPLPPQPLHFTAGAIPAPPAVAGSAAESDSKKQRAKQHRYRQ